MASEGLEGNTSKEVAKAGKDPFWEHGEKVGTKVRCRFCDHKVSGGISRLKQHLAHERGNCAPCPNVTPDVKAKARAAVDALKSTKVAKEARLQSERDEVQIGEETSVEQSHAQFDRSMFQGSSTSSNKGVSTIERFIQAQPEAIKGKGEKVQTTIKQHLQKKAREDACEWIARTIFENALPFNIVNSKSWRQMLEAVGKHGENLKGPSAYELAEKYLPTEVAIKKEGLKTFLQTCRIHGCSLMSDAWTDRKGRSIMNLVINCLSGTMFYNSENTSADTHDGFFIYKLISNTIEELGENCVVQVVTDNASNNVAAAKLLEVARPQIFWTFCGAHTINLMLKDIACIKPIRSAIVMARTVTVFIYAHMHVLDWMRECTKGDIVRPGTTRFATAFLSLQSIKEKKKGLKMMVNATHWEEKLKESDTAEGRKVYLFMSLQSCIIYVIYIIHVIHCTLLFNSIVQLCRCIGLSIAVNFGKISILP
jgi:hypothetical protein